MELLSHPLICLRLNPSHKDIRDVGLLNDASSCQKIMSEVSYRSFCALLFAYLAGTYSTYTDTDMHHRHIFNQIHLSCCLCMPCPAHTTSSSPSFPYRPNEPLLPNSGHVPVNSTPTSSDMPTSPLLLCSIGPGRHTTWVIGTKPLLMLGKS